MEDQIVAISMTIGGRFEYRTLVQIAKVFLTLVQTEAKKDFTKREAGVQDRERLLRSFSYRVTPPKTIEILSDWPGLKNIVEGRRPFRMKWLNRKAGIKVVPIVDHDTRRIVFRTPPLTTGSAWIHPAIAKHAFLERAIFKIPVTIIEHFIAGQKDTIIEDIVGAFKTMKAKEE